LSKFTDQTDWHKPQGAGYVTTAVLEWEVGKVGSGLWVRVPWGFAFDVSVPWFARWLFKPTDTRYRKAAALHDYALSLGWDRVASAALFNDALKAGGVGSVERFAMTVGVIVWKWK
jgi:hypothetical protein